jgi:hypothetical protein
MRGSWKSAAAGSITSSITHPRIDQVAHSSILVVQFEMHRTSKGRGVREETDVQATGPGRRCAVADGLGEAADGLGEATEERGSEGREAAAHSVAKAGRGLVPGRTGNGAYPRRWLMLPVVLIAMFMAGFDVRVCS